MADCVASTVTPTMTASVATTLAAGIPDRTSADSAGTGTAATAAGTTTAAGTSASATSALRQSRGCNQQQRQHEQ
jgi:hypothetical protein